MLRPERMVKVTVVGANNYLEEVVETLYDLGVMHIKEYTKEEEFFDIGRPFERAEHISKVLLKIRTAINSLPAIDEQKMKKSKTFKNIRELEKFINSLLDTINEVQDKKRQVEAEINDLNEKLKLIKMIEPLGLKLDVFQDYDSIAWQVGYVEDERVKQSLEKAVSKCEIYLTKTEKRCLIAIFFDKNLSSEVSKILNEYNFEEVDITKLKGMRGTAEGAEKNLIKQIKQLEKELRKHEKALTSLSEENMKTLKEWHEYLSMEAEKAEAPLKFGKSENAFIVTGWLPKRDAERVKRALEKITNRRVFMKFEEVDEKREEAPVKMSHPKPVDQFQYLMKMYSLPKYSEIDPTFFVFLTFPIFFGMILGDIGYGLVSLIAFLFLRKKLPTLRPLINILILSSISTIVFGCVFGEFFGFEALFGYELPRLMSRLHETIQLLMVAVLIGVVHVNLGFILGFVNEFRTHGFVRAMLEKGSWIIIEIGVVLYYAGSKGYINLAPEIGLVTLVAGILMLMKGEGMKGVVELPTLLSHTLSYARLMGAGLASVGLAAVINDIVGSLFGKGGVFILFGVALLLLGHVMNLLLGLMESFLHSLRLNYVEFFTKFYKGGGIPYVPFGGRKCGGD